MHVCTYAANSRSRNDVSGTGLVDSFTHHYKGDLLTPVQWYNGSIPNAWRRNLPALLAAINALQQPEHAGMATPSSSGAPKVGLLCNCGSEEVADILDGIAASPWPVTPMTHPDCRPLLFRSLGGADGGPWIP